MTRVLYCNLCGQPVVLDGDATLTGCQRDGCRGRSFKTEPPFKAAVPLVWTEQDRKFLRALRIAVAEPERTT